MTAFDLTADLVRLRRELHQIPEVGLQTPRTQQAVLAALDGLGLEITLGRDTSSVVAVLRGPAGPGAPVVLLRGDMDALPLVEDSGEEFAATGGAMHACGHDLHTAGLVGAARLLAGRREELAGDVLFMFQPGEEGYDGAGVMLAEGVLDAAGRRVDAAYGLHVFSAPLPSGIFATRPGPILAASSGLHVTVHGRGGHGSQPSAAADPIVVAAEMVTALQTVVTRTISVFDPVVVTVGTFHAGTRRNIIPATATFEATVRTFTAAALDAIRTATVRLCHDIATAHGVSADIEFIEEYPVTVNDDERAVFAHDVAVDLFGEQRSILLPDPIMGSEDFSRVLAAVPGAFVLVGASMSGKPADAPGNHSPQARFDDSILGDTATYLAELAVRELARLSAADVGTDVGDRA